MTMMMVMMVMTMTMTALMMYAIDYDSLLFDDTV